MSAKIRSSYTKLGIHHFKRSRAASWSEIAARIGERTLSEIREASPVALLPAEVHAKVAGALVDALGARDARSAWRDVMVDAFGRALLRPLVVGALGLYGRKPSSIMRMTPQGWSLVWHECGRAWMEEDGRNRATMHFESLPRVIAESEGIVDSFAANCDAALVHVGMPGVVAPFRDELDSGRLRIEVSWNPVRPPGG